MVNMNNRVYKNNKNGNLYQLLHVATDRTNAREGAKVIVYSPLDDRSEIAVRDEAEFHEKFTKVDDN